jgi:hypothetical protein
MTTHIHYLCDHPSIHGHTHKEGKPAKIYHLYFQVEKNLRQERLVGFLTVLANGLMMRGTDIWAWSSDGRGENKDEKRKEGRREGGKVE